MDVSHLNKTTALRHHLHMTQARQKKCETSVQLVYQAVVGLYEQVFRHLLRFRRRIFFWTILLHYDCLELAENCTWSVEKICSFGCNASFLCFLE